MCAHVCRLLVCHACVHVYITGYTCEKGNSQVMEPWLLHVTGEGEEAAKQEGAGTDDSGQQEGAGPDHSRWQEGEGPEV